MATHRLPALAAALLVTLVPAVAQETPADSRDEVVHVLNRITYGPRPGDVEAVQKTGLRNYIEQQLHPESIDDSATDKAVACFDLLQLPADQLGNLYFAGQQANKEKLAELAKQNGGNVDTNNEQQRQQAEQLRKQQQDANAGMTPMQRATQMLNNPLGKSVAVVGQLQQDKLVRAVDSNRQLLEVLVDFWSNHFNIDVKKGPDRVLKVADDRTVIRPHILGKFRDMLEASAKSPAMLFYLDNALNSKNMEVTPMMEAMAERMKESGKPVPPMLADAKAGKKVGGINENYAREIMELHTLGVDGGYTQQDVQEVARCFTGWSIKRETGDFFFRPMAHDNGAKIVLGHTIPAGGGMKDGEMVLDILCSNPATAHHIAYEMCQRFVSDNPSEALVKRVAEVFTRTDGDLRQVTEAILTSPEFLSPDNFNNKIKSPLEFAVSAVRASGSTITPQQPAPFDKLVPLAEGAATMGREGASDRLTNRPRQSLNWHIYELGEPLFACSPPTGYKETSTTWVSPGALIERLNFAMALTEQKVADVKFNSQTIIGTTDTDKPEAVLNHSVSVLLQDRITDTTRKVLEQTALPSGDAKTVNPNKLIALILGSPEFQRK